MTDSTSANGTDQQTFNNELRGVLFKNDKGGNDKRPDYRGRCTIDGKEYRISGWIRKAVQSGQTFLSLAYTPEQPKQEQTSIDAGDFTKAGEVTAENDPGF